MQDLHKNKSRASYSMRLFKVHIIEPILHHFNFDLVRIRPEWRSHINDVDTRQMVAEKTSKALVPYIKNNGLPIDEEKICTWFEEFSELIFQCPIQRRFDSNGFNAGFVLFALARSLNPPIVVESGVFQGFTTWIIENALPETKIYCFDRSFSRVKERSKNARYFKYDWSKFDFTGFPTKNALVVFSDHINQATRALQCLDRGFRHVVFNENLPVHAIHAGSFPISPTLDMVLDKTLIQGQGIHWESSIGHCSYNHNIELSMKVRAAIEKIIRLPGLAEETGYKPAHLTYSRIATA